MQISGQMLNRLHTKYILWAWPIARILLCIVIFLFLPPSSANLYFTTSLQPHFYAWLGWTVAATLLTIGGQLRQPWVLRAQVIGDTVEQAEAVALASRTSGEVIPALIEIDCDGHRSGVPPQDKERILSIGHAITQGGELRGVMTHAGGSYAARGATALRQAAETERRSVVDAANILRQAGLPCPVVSVGSTPTAHYATDLSGVTEVRAGVFVFFDLVMAGIGICEIDDIAMSVLATVIGHQREKGWILIDAGWMAMSQDRGTSKQEIDQGYGLVCDSAGTPFQDLILADANQEHGILKVRPGSNAVLPELAIGDRVRILPNHACATGAQHRSYHIVHGTSDIVTNEWVRFTGW